MSLQNKMLRGYVVSGRKVGFYAGAFDPIHDGHVEVARSALKYLELDIVYLMVEEELWTDKQPVVIHHRRTMVDLAISEDKNIQQLELQDKKFSIASTLKDLEKRFENDELFFVFGADVFMHMDAQQWPGLEKLFNHNIVVFERRYILEPAISLHAKSLGIAIAILPSVHPHHSSTDVRLNIDDKAIWVPKEVDAYMSQRKLYEVEG